MEKLLKKSSHKNKKIHKKSIRKEFKRKLISYKKRTKQFLINENFDLIKPLIFIINIALLFINILLLFIPQKNNKHSSTLKLFKDSDKFNFNLFRRPYQYISNYLLNKYTTINNNTNHNIKSTEKKVIKLKREGIYDRNRNLKWLKTRLSDQFILQYDDPNPDYLLFNCFSDRGLEPKYQNLIKIAIYTENQIPDLNCADYFLAHYHINYLDRYFKSNIFFWESFNEIDSKRLEVINSPIRKKFCAAAYSNCIAKFRLDFIEQLSNYKKVDMGGKCKNNIGEKIKDKLKFLSEYKFSIAMENSEGNGYVSEKIIDSFKAGTIPIYYGDYLIDEYINPKTYILIRGEKDIEKKIEYIKKIDNDDKLYMKIMKEKPIIDDKFIEKIDQNEIKEFLSNIFSQDKNKAYRRDDNFFDFNPDLICKLK